MSKPMQSRHRRVDRQKLGERLQDAVNQQPCDECHHPGSKHLSAYYGECSWLDVTCWSEYKCTECAKGDDNGFS